MITELYEKKLKYNCSYYEMKSEIYSDLLIVFIGTSEFVVSNNFFGVVAIGRRSFDWDTNTALYKYELKENSVHLSRIEALIKTYERKRVKIERVKVERVEVLQ